MPRTTEERQKSRYSFAYFIAPDNETIIRALNASECDDSAVVITGAEEINAYTAYEHIMERVNTSYGVKVTKISK